MTPLCQQEQTPPPREIGFCVELIATLRHRGRGGRGELMKCELHLHASEKTFLAFFFFFEEYMERGKKKTFRLELRIWGSGGGGARRCNNNTAGARFQTRKFEGETKGRTSARRFAGLIIRKKLQAAYVTQRFQPPPPTDGRRGGGGKNPKQTCFSSRRGS